MRVLFFLFFAYVALFFLQKVFFRIRLLRKALSAVRQKSFGRLWFGRHCTRILKRNVCRRQARRAVRGKAALLFLFLPFPLDFSVSHFPPVVFRPIFRLLFSSPFVVRLIRPPFSSPFFARLIRLPYPPDFSACFFLRRFFARFFPRKKIFKILETMVNDLLDNGINWW